MQKRNFPLIEKALSLLVEDKLNDSNINALLSQIGMAHNLSHITVNECNDSEHSIKCTYEWSNDDLLPLLYTEHRYYNVSDYGNWKYDLFIANNYRIIVNGDQAEYDRLLCSDAFGTIIRLPLILNSNAIGCLDLYSEDYDKVFRPDEIDEFSQLAWILSSYILHLISIRKTITEEQSASVAYDSITKLPKYDFFYQQLTEIYNYSETPIVLLCIDFSNLKYLNDKYGYLEGNNFFLMFARKIYELSDNILGCCRSYSDNFIIACRSDHDSDVETLKQVIKGHATKMVEDFHRYYFDCNIIINAGIYIMRKKNERLDQAISNANLARKYAKTGKPDKGYRCLLYHAGMSVRMKRKAEYISQIDQALVNEDLVIEFQPRCMTDTFDIIGAEALVRWDMHKGYLLYPDEFIKTLEEDGSIIKLDYYVYEKVFDYLYKRTSHNLPVVPISLNVSVVHFYNKDLISYIRFLHRSYPIDPSLIEFELNEQIYTSELSNVETIINELQAMGFNIIIDEFGAGYSSLNTFTKYKINGISLSRNFMRHSLEHNDKIIISCIVNMANRLDLRVVCEGVETDDQRDFLIKNNCQYMQGNYFSKSVSMEEFSYMLEN